MKIIPIRKLVDGQQYPTPDSKLHAALLKDMAVLPVLLYKPTQEVPMQILYKGKDCCISFALSFFSQIAQYLYHFRNQKLHKDSTAFQSVCSEKQTTGLKHWSKLQKTLISLGNFYFWYIFLQLVKSMKLLGLHGGNNIFVALKKLL